jgi:hypothetical protein
MGAVAAEVMEVAVALIAGVWAAAVLTVEWEVEANLWVQSLQEAAQMKCLPLALLRT